MPSIDLFASMNNKKLERYVSWKPDPDAFAVDAFSLDWKNEFYYIFPPFAILGQVISKIRQDNCHCILIAPDWPTQHWFPMLSKIARKEYAIKNLKNTLSLSHDREKVHPLYPKMIMKAFLIKF